MRACLTVAAVISLAAGVAFAQDAADGSEAGDRPGESRRSLLHFIRSGGPVGYVIIALSLAGVALVIDAFLHLKPDKLLPPPVSEQSERLARRGKFSEMLALCRGNDSMLSRIIRGAMGQRRGRFDSAQLLLYHKW